ncbi:Lsr2 family protein [Microcystis phage MinS1]|nr:Lsr2 family protein [Microcystis phage MinS1]
MKVRTREELDALEERANVLTAVYLAKNPRTARPTIASEHDLTITELDELLRTHGWPDRDQLRRSIAELQRGHDPAVDVTTGPNSSGAPTASAPFVTAVPIDRLFVDHAYQRELDERRVQRMVSAYDPALVGILEVAARGDGRFAILDGQHRWALYRDVTFDSDETPHMVCRVHPQLTLDSEARLYHQLNTTRKQLTGWDRWVARRTAGEQIVLDIEAAAERAGYRIAMTEGDNVIRSTRACENVVELGGIALLDSVLAVIRAAYRGDQTGVDAAIVHGLGHVLRAYRDDLDHQRLVDALSGVLPRQLTARAAAVREIHHGTKDRLTGHVIVELYNSRPGRRVEAFFDRVKPLSKSKGAEARKNEAIREWAKREGIDVPPKQIPRRVRDAYDSRHQDDLEREAS